MAIALDAVSNGNSSPVSHVITGSNLVLFVASWEASGQTVSAVLYNGVAMTEWTTANDGSDGTLRLWYLLAPATGTHDITWTGSGQIVAASYSGVRQNTTNWTTNNNSQGSVTSLTTSVTPARDNSWIIVGGGSTNPSTWANGTNTTVRDQTSRSAIYDSGVITPAAATTVGIAVGSSNNLVLVSTSIEPVIEATVTDGMKVGDVPTAYRILSAVLTDGIKVGDVVIAIKQMLATVVDTLFIGDLVGELKLLWRRAAKNLADWIEEIKH